MSYPTVKTAHCHKSCDCKRVECIKLNFYFYVCSTLLLILGCFVVVAGCCWFVVVFISFSFLFDDNHNVNDISYWAEYRTPAILFFKCNLFACVTFFCYSQLYHTRFYPPAQITLVKLCESINKKIKKKQIFTDTSILLNTLNALSRDQQSFQGKNLKH